MYQQAMSSLWNTIGIEFSHAIYPIVTQKLCFEKSFNTTCYPRFIATGQIFIACLAFFLWLDFFKSQVHHPLPWNAFEIENSSQSSFTGACTKIFWVFFRNSPQWDKSNFWRLHAVWQLLLKSTMLFPWAHCWWKVPVWNLQFTIPKTV